MDPKLIQARAEIESILTKHDIAAHVVLHNAPGSSEVFLRLTPSYSKLKEEAVGDSGVTFRLRSRAADYGGDVDRQRRDLAATANMVSSIGQLLAQAAVPMLGMAESIDRAVGASHRPLGSTHGPGH